jgi:hypothetical protein
VDLLGNSIVTLLVPGWWSILRVRLVCGAVFHPFVFLVIFGVFLGILGFRVCSFMSFEVLFIYVFGSCDYYDSARMSANHAHATLPGRRKCRPIF